jgi:hypothetical protein
VTRVLLTVAAAAAIAVLAILAGRGDDQRTAPRESAGRAPVVVTPPPQPPSTFTPDELDQQDRPGREHERRVAEASTTRPLLRLLPTRVDGVRIEIAGLDADNRTTLLDVYPGGRGAAHAREVYRRALLTVGDDGSAYRVRIVASPRRRPDA